MSGFLTASNGMTSNWTSGSEIDMTTIDSISHGNLQVKMSK
jgi:hypothetical protein